MHLNEGMLKYLKMYPFLTTIIIAANPFFTIQLVGEVRINLSAVIAVVALFIILKAKLAEIEKLPIKSSSFEFICDSSLNTKIIIAYLGCKIEF
jgi:hypothetical protein